MNPSNGTNSLSSLKNLVSLLESNLSSSHRLIEEASSKLNHLIHDLSSASSYFENSSEYCESCTDEDNEVSLPQCTDFENIDKLNNHTGEYRLHIGSKVVWLVGDERVELGTVQWLGMMHDGLVAGIEFDDPVGNSDGHLDGKKLFTCKNGHGRFVLVRELLLATDFFVES